MQEVDDSFLFMQNLCERQEEAQFLMNNAIIRANNILEYRILECTDDILVWPWIRLHFYCILTRISK